MSNCFSRNSSKRAKQVVRLVRYKVDCRMVKWSLDGRNNAWSFGKEWESYWGCANASPFLVVCCACWLPQQAHVFLCHSIVPYQHTCPFLGMMPHFSNITYVISTRRTDTLSDVIHGSTERLPKAGRRRAVKQFIWKTKLNMDPECYPSSPNNLQNKSE